MRNTRLLITLLVAAALGLAACGGTSKVAGIETAPGAGATQAAIPTTPKPPPALATKPTVTVPTGAAPRTLVVKDLVVGTGKTAQPGQTVTVNYVGVLYKGGKEFDSSWSRNQPFTTALSASGVIQGWVKGVAGMKVGGRRELIIPPSLGYGAAGSPPTIPANATLVFVIDLLSIAS
jgi:FKBP-type peptidyl-prolyl cis-trans isomerase/predicted small secreted protein